MSVTQSVKAEEKYDRVLTSPKEVLKFEREALAGGVEPGIYKIDVSEIEADMSYPEDRLTPGAKAKHSEVNLETVVRVLSSEESMNDQAGLLQYMAEEYEDPEFLRPEGYEGSPVASMRTEDALVQRACVIQED